MKHINEIFCLAQKNSGKVVDLPNGIYAENIYGDIYIKSKKNKSNENNKKESLEISNEIWNTLTEEEKNKILECN